MTDPDSYTTTTAYDAFDRPTRVTYPDSTADATTYDKLDVAAKTDRLGRTTRHFYDGIQPIPPDWWCKTHPPQ